MEPVKLQLQELSRRERLLLKQRVELKIFACTLIDKSNLQRAVFDRVMLHNDNTILQAENGIGKSFMIQRIYPYLLLTYGVNGVVILSPTHVACENVGPFTKTFNSYFIYDERNASMSNTNYIQIIAILYIFVKRKS